METRKDQTITLPFQPRFSYTDLNGNNTRWMPYDQVRLVDADFTEKETKFDMLFHNLLKMIPSDRFMCIYTIKIKLL